MEKHVDNYHQRCTPTATPGCNNNDDTGAWDTHAYLRYAFFYAFLLLSLNYSIEQESYDRHKKSLSNVRVYFILFFLFLLFVRYVQRNDAASNLSGKATPCRRQIVEADESD